MLKRDEFYETAVPVCVEEIDGKQEDDYDDYGLGSRQEIEQDDEDEPMRKVPAWAAGHQVLVAMEQQDDHDPALLFAPCSPPRLSLIFTKY